VTTDSFANLAIDQTQKIALRKQLENLAERHPDPRIQEMAHDVLAGKQDLRAAMLGPRYEDALNESMARFSSWYTDLSDEQRAEQDRQAAEYFEQLRQESANEAKPRRARRAPAEDDDWEPPATVFRRGYGPRR